MRQPVTVTNRQNAQKADSGADALLRCNDTAKAENPARMQAIEAGSREEQHSINEACESLAIYKEILREMIFQAETNMEDNEPDPEQDPVERWKIAIAGFCMHHPETDPTEFLAYPPLTKEQEDTPAGNHLTGELFLLNIVRRALFREEQESVYFARHTAAE